MTAFNSNSKNERKTVNGAGGVAFTMTPEMDLYSQVCTMMMYNKVYEGSVSEQIKRLKRNIAAVDADLVCKMAIYCREQMYLRSVPIVMIVELLDNFDKNIQKGARVPSILRATITRIISRADEITEMLSYYASTKDSKKRKKLNKLPNVMADGIAAAFNKFDAYQLAKYKADGKAIKMRDAMFLTHPKPNSKEKEELFKQLAEDSLPVPATWEVKLSELGKVKFTTEASKRQATASMWSDLLSSNKLGYMAALRNINNMLETKDDKLVDLLCQTIANPVKVKRSKQFPFRFWSAFKAINGISDPTSSYRSNPFAIDKINTALEDAILASVDAIKGFDTSTKVVIACDVSSSMQKNISKSSDIMRFDVGLILGLLLKTKCKSSIFGVFGDTWKVKRTVKGVLDGVLDSYKNEGEVGYSTNGHLVISDLIKRNIEADKIMMFTDCNLWNSSGVKGSLQSEWTKYKSMYPAAKLYLFDLSGDGTMPVDASKDVKLISGFSNKIFDIMEAVDNSPNALSFISNTHIVGETTVEVEDDQQD